MRSSRHALVLALPLAVATTFHAAGALAAQVTIDFTTNVTLTPQGRIDRSQTATFSRDLYTHPDGFEPYTGGAYNYYGENDELVTFDAPIRLVSLDIVSPFLSLPAPTEVHLRLLDSNDALLEDVLYTPDGVTTTITLDLANVKKLVFHTVGGDPTFYGDGRTHAWYYVDNLVYDDAGCGSDAQCPAQAPACLPNGLCGQCSATMPCTDVDDCHPGACDLTSGTCSNPAAPDGAPCDDDEACTTPDTCTAGACVGASVVCTAQDECHVAGACDDLTGACSNPSQPDGAPCSIGTCQLGVCTSDGEGGASEGGAPSTGGGSEGGAGGAPTEGGFGGGGAPAEGGSSEGGNSAEGGGPSEDGADASDGGCSCRAAGAGPRSFTLFSGLLGAMLVALRRGSSAGRRRALRGPGRDGTP